MLIDQVVTGVAPSVRIHGVPETAGPFSIKLTAMDAIFRADWILLKGTIQDTAVSPDPGGNDHDPVTGGSDDPSLNVDTASTSSTDRLANTGTPHSNGFAGIALLLAGGAALVLARTRSRLR